MVSPKNKENNSDLIKGDDDDDDDIDDIDPRTVIDYNDGESDFPCCSVSQSCLDDLGSVALIDS